jgi:hypothetical protein
LLKGVGLVVSLAALVSLFFVKSLGGALLILLVPVSYLTIAYFLTVKFRSALMMNVIDFSGVRSESRGEVVCELEWNEIGDFGIAEVRRGLFKGYYVYMSRIFVSDAIKHNIIKYYDPRICIVFPYTEETAYALCEASGEKIDLS